ncbi:hypothetical protein BKA70DRAFT_1399114 [Coprinopsis sp. MPI-PUGE-AT-0042]|nr:hypothetical protein BKA70DRAFT_1399114 [Coprinopsis sp. MPI-PUGE-AT-0042]
MVDARQNSLEGEVKDTGRSPSGGDQRSVGQRGSQVAEEEGQHMALVDAMKNDVSHEDASRRRSEEEVGRELRGGDGGLRAEKDAEIAARVNRIGLPVALKGAQDQHEGLRHLSENKVMRKGQTIEEPGDQKLAYAQCVDETDKGTTSSAIDSSGSRWNVSELLNFIALPFALATLLEIKGLPSLSEGGRHLHISCVSLSNSNVFQHRHTFPLSPCSLTLALRPLNGYPPFRDLNATNHPDLRLQLLWSGSITAPPILG